MAAKTLQQVLEVHDKIVDGFEKHRKTLSRTRPTGKRLVVTRKRMMLAQLDQRLENAIQARDDSIRRHDAGIARIELSREKLAAEIAGDEKKLGGGDGDGSDPRPTEPSDPVVTPPTRPTRPTRPARPGGTTPVLRVRGVGAAFEERLKANKINTAEELAAMQPARLAAILSISEERASVLVRTAKRTQ